MVKHLAAAQSEQALKPAQELAALRGRVQGAAHWEAVNARWQVKAVDRLRKQDAAAQKEMARVLALRQQADALEGKGKAREALPLRQQGLDLRRKLLGEEHPDTALSYNNQAFNENAQGRYEDAERSARKAVALHRKLLGEEHPLTARGYNNLALHLTAQGKFAEAEEAHSKALALRRKLLGEKHPDTALSYNNLADADAA